MNIYEPVQYKVIGTKNIMGTNWSVERVLARRADGRKWKTYTLCNGTVDFVKNHNTKREALASFNEYTEIGN